MNLAVVKKEVFGTEESSPKLTLFDRSWLFKHCRCDKREFVPRKLLLCDADSLLYPFFRLGKWLVLPESAGMNSQPASTHLKNDKFARDTMCS